MADLDPEQIDKEMLPFLSVDSRPDVRIIAVQYFLGLTGSDDGKHFIASNDKYLTAIVNNSEEGSQPAIQKDALLSLVNLSTERDIAYKLLNLRSKPDFVYNLVKYVLAEDSVHADIACSVLNNLSRTETGAEKIVQDINVHSDDVGFHRIVYVFGLRDYNKHATLHFLAMFLGNLAQVVETRRYLLDRERCVIQRLLPFTTFEGSAMRRGGVVSILRNCCFDTASHDWLLGDKVNILPRLLLPLAGGEEFDEDDMERLPDDLQYLEPDKQRESDPDIRILLLETITQLCATKPGREYVKSKNAYIIIRELHKWEKDPAALIAIENLIQILIGDEPEKGMENLKEVEIPADIENKLDKARGDLQRQIEDDTKKLDIQDTQGGEGVREGGDREGVREGGDIEGVKYGGDSEGVKEGVEKGGEGK